MYLPVWRSGNREIKLNRCLKSFWQRPNLSCWKHSEITQRAGTTCSKCSTFCCLFTFWVLILVGADKTSVARSIQWSRNMQFKILSKAKYFLKVVFECNSWTTNAILIWNVILNLSSCDQTSAVIGIQRWRNTFPKFVSNFNSFGSFVYILRVIFSWLL